MFADEPEVISVIREWVQKAENDLTNAAQVLKLGKRCPTIPSVSTLNSALRSISKPCW
jgi:hypothetical protein